MKKVLKKEKGFALSIVLIVAILAITLIFGMYQIFKNNTFTIDNDAISKEMFYHAKTGIDIGETALYKNKKRIFTALMSGTIDELNTTIDNSNINLPSDIEILISLKYFDESETTDESKKNMFEIKSKAVNTSTGNTYSLTKYLDGIHMYWFYE